MADHVLSQEELHAHLKEQIGFLERSAEAYDAGFEGEAKRMAVTLRVLVHDTGVSASLLGQLGMKSGDFVDTAHGIAPANSLATHSLIGVRFADNGSKWAPLLDTNQAKHIPFDAWWSQTVFIDPNGETLSRRELVLTAANKDGGGHVDATLTTKYAVLKSEASLGWVPVGNAEPLKNPEQAAIRQIAHEMLKTLRPGYQRTHETPGVIFSGMGLTPVDQPIPPSAGGEISDGKWRFLPERGEFFYKRNESAFSSVPGKNYLFQVEIDSITQGEIFGVLGGNLTAPMRTPGQHCVRIASGSDDRVGILGRSTDAVISRVAVRPDPEAQAQT
jgi:hypothetical protein